MISLLLSSAHPNNDVPLKFDDEFWTHLSEHLLMSYAFVILGILFSIAYFNYILLKKIRIDHELEKSSIVRVFTPSGKKILVCNPSKIVEWIDIILLTYFDKGEDKIIDSHSIKRVRAITLSTLVVSTFMILTGFFLILSAFEKNMNPLDYL